jgi:hypothetical protein
MKQDRREFLAASLGLALLPLAINSAAPEVVGATCQSKRLKLQQRFEIFPLPLLRSQECLKFRALSN